MVEPINYNGVDGVFIPASEFEYIKIIIRSNGKLLNNLLDVTNKDSKVILDHLDNLK